MGYRLQFPENIRVRHVQVLVDRWESESLAPSTLNTRVSNLTVFGRWIGKNDLTYGWKTWLKDPAVAQRSSIAKVDHSWKAKGVDPLKIISMIEESGDEHVALYLSLQLYFGLRVKESIELNPFQALIHDEDGLLITRGTKGGRPRPVTIKTQEQRDLLKRAMLLASGHQNRQMRWPDCTWKQAQVRYYNRMKKFGITQKDFGVHSHGLRTTWTHVEYGRLTGLPTPMEGGAIGIVTHKIHLKATLAISAGLGHARTDVVGNYYGSYGHALRNTIVAVT
jgi:integrase